MPKRPDTKETVLLAIELMKRIPRHGSVTVQDLHRQLVGTGLERDERTVMRQLKMLSENFDIERDDRTRPFGYRWKTHATNGIGITNLSEQESLLLSLAEQHLKTLLPASLMNSMEGFYYQARKNLLPYTDAKREREWLSKIRVVSISQPLLPPTVKPGVFEQVSNALYANQWLNVDYESQSGKRSKADVMPLGLAQQGLRLYLVCRFEGYENERSLALHRFHSAKASTLTFERPKDFNLATYDEEGRFNGGDGARIKLTFQISKEAGKHLLETPLSKDQIVHDLGDDYKISATVIDSMHLDFWLRGFGDDVDNIRKRKVTELKNLKAPSEIREGRVGE
jgi:predicted DNA-binding transcriptional regulator YafY